jgi:hypothetical protein
MGLPSVGAVNQQAMGNANVQFTNPGYQSLQLIGNAGGSPDAMYIDSGLNDPTKAGSLVGTNLLNLSLASGGLVASAMSNVPVPQIIGEAAAYGSALVSQTSSGLDFLQFNAQTGVLRGSDLVPGTAGLPKAVGVASNSPGPEFSGVGTGDSVVTQLANGQIDLIGFSGGFGSLAGDPRAIKPSSLNTLSPSPIHLLPRAGCDGYPPYLC